ncbi:glycosyltransferase [Aurantiacibacter xanthus]|nr:glycosyltransferase [Aurantiacibacter xanthus]
MSSASFDWLKPDRSFPSGIPPKPHALELDMMLWRGFDQLVLPRLHALLDHGPPAEMASAGWVLARWYLAQGDMARARKAIITFHSHPEGTKAVPHPGPFLLAVRLCLTADDQDDARNILQKGTARFGELPDFALARLLIAKARGVPERELSAILRQVYRDSSLTEVDLAEGDGDLFDRLRAGSVPSPQEPSDNLPLVSVIVPVFNAADLLPTALRGLQAQSWSNLEILVVDDGSTDNSVAMAQAAATQDTRIRVLPLGCNQGAYPARNAAFATARGTFVTVHDADDWSHPQKIEQQARALMDDPALKASVSHWVRAGNALEMTLWRMEESWVHRNVSSLMIRTSLRDELGYWDRTRINADTEYYYRILHVYGPGAIREVSPGLPLAFGRTLPQSLTNRSATHLRTQYHGIRRDYMEAAHAWHARATQTQDLYLPQHPANRSFHAPEDIALDDQSTQQTEYDLLAGSDLLDEAWYLLANPDVMQSDLGAVRHYLTVGARENRDPGPRFSTGGYRRTHKLDPDENPLLHFLRQGSEDRSECLPSFLGRLDRDTQAADCVLVFAHTSGATLFGAERSLLDVVKRLGRSGLRPVVVLPSLRNPAYLERLLEISAVVETLPQAWRHGLLTPDTETIEAARALIRKHRPVEIHVNTIVLDAPLLAARAENVPSVVYVREMPPEDRAICRLLGMGPEAVRAQLLAQADRFIMPSQVVADWLASAERCTVRPNAVDEALFDLPFVPGAVLKAALISSNIVKKGINDFVTAAHLVAATGWPVHFLLIGPKTGDLAALHTLPPNVALRSYAATPAEAIAQADIVLSLSHFAESFGRTVVEAMAAGRPVICYDRGAPPSLVISGKTGFVVPADSPKSVADAVLALDAARLQLDKMSRAARKRAREIQDQALA